jgi:tetratricopeptide (TPR) repeat protein
MKIAAILGLFVACAVITPLAVAQTPGGAKPSAARPARDTAAEKASMAAAQRDADETLGRTYLATKRYTEAAAVYERLLKANPRNPGYANFAGIAWMQYGDMRMARNWFQRAIKIESRFADAYNNLGATYYSEKNFKRALQYYRRAVALQPGIAGYHTNVGYAYFSLKMPVEAEEAFRRALLMDPLIFQQNGRNGSVLQDRSVVNQGLFAFTMAKSYAGISDPLRCAAYLKRALDEGYKDIAKVYTDPDFAPMLTEPDVQAVLNLIPPPGTAAASDTAR